MDANGLKSQPMGGFIPVGKNLVFGKKVPTATHHAATPKAHPSHFQRAVHVPQAATVRHSPRAAAKKK